VNFNVGSLWIVSALCSAALGALVLAVRKKYPQYLARELTAWGAAYVCLALGFAIFFARPWVGRLSFRVIGPTLVVLGISLSLRAIAELKHQPCLAVWLIGPPLLVMAECFLFTFGTPNATIELFLFNTVNMVLLFRISATLMKREGEGRPFVDALAGFSYAAFAVVVFFVLLDYLLKGHFTVQYNFNSARTFFNSIMAIVAEAVLFSMFLLVVGERVHRDLKVQAMHDSLTGLFNRRAFEEIALHEFSGAERTDTALSLLMIDIDRFKLINDEHGHMGGDQVLKQAAQVLSRSLREEDFLCRWGGEEFCALLPRATRKQAGEVAERALREFSTANLRVHGRPIRVTVSIGIATIQGGLSPFTELVEAADTALYRAKAQGRNNCVHADAVHSGAATPASLLP
jgi:diguanylate cyclase (GGDEF)-like protein